MNVDSLILLNSVMQVMKDETRVLGVQERASTFGLPYCQLSICWVGSSQQKAASFRSRGAGALVHQLELAKL